MNTARIITAYLEEHGDKYNLANSCSIRVLAIDLEEALNEGTIETLRQLRDLPHGSYLLTADGIAATIERSRYLTDPQFQHHYMVLAGGSRIVLSNDGLPKDEAAAMERLPAFLVAGRREAAGKS